GAHVVTLFHGSNCESQIDQLTSATDCNSLHGSSAESYRIDSLNEFDCHTFITPLSETDACHVATGAHVIWLYEGSNCESQIDHLPPPPDCNPLHGSPAKSYRLDSLNEFDCHTFVTTLAETDACQIAGGGHVITLYDGSFCESETDRFTTAT